MKAALIGHGIGASLTPAMHEAEGQALGVEYSYVRFDTSEAPWHEMTLREMIRRAETDGFSGVNITHPFKTAVLDLVDEISPVARAVNAANTIVFSKGRRVAHNTDQPGFRRAFETLGPDLARDHVLLFGAGGAGPAVATALLEAGVRRLDIVDTAAGKARDAAERLARQHPTAEVRAHETLAQIDPAAACGMVNATPVGMTGHPGMACDPALLSASAWVADIVYFPRETELLRTASARGLRVLPGTAMALYQAVEAFGLITGHIPDAARMAASLDAMLAGAATPSGKEQEQ